MKDFESLNIKEFSQQKNSSPAFAAMAYPLSRYRKRFPMAAEKKGKDKKPRKWSAGVMQKSNALDLEKDIFKSDDPKKIARSLKASATRSHRKKGTPYQSAMSMLNFYINRAGHNLPASQKKVLEEAKEELRKVFHREDKEADK